MKNSHKALEAIERLVGGDFGLDMEWYSTSTPKNRNKDPKWLQENLLEAAQLITKIYMIAHAEGNCNHPEWEKEKFKVLEALNS